MRQEIVRQRQDMANAIHYIQILQATLQTQSIKLYQCQKGVREVPKGSSIICTIKLAHLPGQSKINVK